MRRDWKSILGVLMVFGLGILAGAFLSLAFVHHRVVVALQRGSPAYEQMLERRLSRGMDLTPDQRQRFHEALVANIEQRKNLQLQLQPQIQEINQATRREFRDILQPAQLATLKDNLQDFRRRFGSPGIGGGGPRHGCDQRGAFGELRGHQSRAGVAAASGLEIRHSSSAETEPVSAYRATFPRYSASGGVGSIPPRDLNSPLPGTGFLAAHSAPSFGR